MIEEQNIVDEITSTDYKYGFISDIENETSAKGLTKMLLGTFPIRKMNPSLCWNGGLRRIVIGKT